MVDLSSSELMGAAEAARIWGKNKDYVRVSIRQSPHKWPAGSWRKFDGRQIVVTVAGMEAVTGELDPRKK
ncbi:helix-turn-helix domain-containing protein [Agrilactobacillus yilanensis]|uniref:Helix-turn-helix domain-containing protein n=1 Tax=Agrilactobacillus yilanensis TaxID=2485997 RepID=A0ABW4JCI6_9LACO|nr:helix-turn-helix domain-containing protein [Agrilactobacillus yilanensis]